MVEPINLNRARKAKARAAAEAVAAANRQKFGRTKAEKLNDAAAVTRLGQTLDKARRDDLAYPPATLQHFADRQLYGVGFTPTGADEYRGLGPISYLIDDRTGDLVFVDNPWTDSAGQKVLRALYPLHSGQVGGLATRLIVLVLGLATVEMAATGIFVWWKKRKARISNRNRARRAAG